MKKKAQSSDTNNRFWTTKNRLIKQTETRNNYRFEI